MGCELLIANFNKGIYKIGDVVAIKDTPCEWGSKECPPNWLIVQVSDANRLTYDSYLNRPWKRIFKFNLEGLSPTMATIRITIDPSVVSASGQNSGVPVDLQLFITGVLGGVILGSGTDYLLVQLPRSLDLPTVRREFQESFGARIGFLRCIDPAFVASAIGGAKPVRTVTQMLSLIKSRLDD